MDPIPGQWTAKGNACLGHGPSKTTKKGYQLQKKTSHVPNSNGPWRIVGAHGVDFEKKTASLQSMGERFILAKASLRPGTVRSPKIRSCSTHGSENKLQTHFSIRESDAEAIHPSKPLAKETFHAAHARRKPSRKEFDNSLRPQLGLEHCSHCLFGRQGFFWQGTILGGLSNTTHPSADSANLPRGVLHTGGQELLSLSLFDLRSLTEAASRSFVLDFLLRSLRRQCGLEVSE